MNRQKTEGRGCVREKLIQAGIELLGKDNGEGLTLRRITAHVGVSHAAPAYYFDGLPGLRLAIAQRGFELFTKALTNARDLAGDDDFSKLEAAADAYIRFAEENTGLFRVMFDELLSPTPELSQEAIGSYMVLKQVCAPFTSAAKGDQMEIMAWAMMHGYTSLHLSRPRAPSAPFTPPSFSSILKLLVRANAAA